MLCYKHQMLSKILQLRCIRMVGPTAADMGAAIFLSHYRELAVAFSINCCPNCSIVCCSGGICNAQCAVWVSEMLLNVNSWLLWSNLCYKGEKGVGNFLMPEKFPITLQPIWCSLMH